MNNNTQLNTTQVDELYEELKGDEKLDYDNIYDMLEDCKATLRKLRIPIAPDDKMTFTIVDEIWMYGKKRENIPMISRVNYSERTFDFEFVRELTDFSDPLLDLLYIKATLYHELLHTCRGCEWHYAPFRKYTKKIFDRQGIRANVIAVGDSIFRNDLPIAYIGECDNCHFTVYGRFQKEIDYYLEEVTMEDLRRGVMSRCPCCGRIYMLTYVREPAE